MHTDVALLNTAVDLGVKGFIVKDAAVEEIVGCIKAAAAGRSFFSPMLTDRLLSRQEVSLAKKLSASERRVLSLVAEAKTNKEIGELMFISIRTVEHHRSSICSKLGLTGKNALLIFALAHKSEL